MLKKSVVIRTPRIKRIPHGINYGYLIIFSIFICGLIIGVHLISVTSEEIQSLTNTIIKNILSAQADSSIFTIFCGYLFIFIMLFFLCCLLGLCPLGIPIIITLPIISGTIIGAFYSSLYLNNGYKGLLFCICIYTPALSIILFIVVVQIS